MRGARADAGDGAAESSRGAEALVTSEVPPEPSEPSPAPSARSDVPSRGPIAGGLPPSSPSESLTRRATLTMALAALGVVFGDIGTSPLYAMQACFDAETGIPPTTANVFGVTSCIFWALTLVIGVKYAALILRVDDDGEGGIFSLLSLLNKHAGKEGMRGLLLFAAVGAALLYGDGIITPAISVLSSLEGAELADPALAAWVVPMSCLILFGLFSVQRFGLDRVGWVFGPIMLLWFVWIAVFGALSIAKNPEILWALSPHHVVLFFAAQPFHAFLILGGVVLCVTGGEALFADLGHFHRRPIQLAWYVVVWPALLINYFGQGALLLTNPTFAPHPFFTLVPRALLLPAVAIAAVAAVIASQAIITGAYSLTRQGIQLGLLPRLTIKHLSADIEGRIYLPAINTLMLGLTLLVVILFRSAGSLAGAYGIAVTAVMATTTLLFGAVLHRVKGWSVPRALLVIVPFLAIDLAFLASNLFKLETGGWFPLTAAALIIAVMLTWRRGRRLLAQQSRDQLPLLGAFLARIASDAPTRVPGAAVYFTRDPAHASPGLVQLYRHVPVLHERVYIMFIDMVPSARVHGAERLAVTNLGNGFWFLRARFGFVEPPNIPRMMALSRYAGTDYVAGNTTYFLSRDVIRPGRGNSMMRWQKRLFSSLANSSMPAEGFFLLPPERVVELGLHTEV